MFLPDGLGTLRAQWEAFPETSPTKEFWYFSVKPLYGMWRRIMADVLSQESRHCSRCGTALNGLADGLCVRCLLTGALTPPPEEGEAGVEIESPATLLAHREFAGYELVDEIARGGMGVVFRARQKRP